MCKETFQTPAHLDAAMTAWLKANFKDLLLYGATLLGVAAQPISALLTASAAFFAQVVYPFAKEELSDSCFPTYAEFKEDFLHHLGEQQEKYGNEFDLKFNIQEFEAWARRDLNA